MFATYRVGCQAQGEDLQQPACGQVLCTEGQEHWNRRESRHNTDYDRAVDPAQALVGEISSDGHDQRENNHG